MVEIVEFVSHHSIAHPRILPTRRKRHRDIFYTCGVIAYFVSNFVVNFDWHHSIALPLKPTVRRKHLTDISWISRVIADFVPNFVAMATGVGRGWICLASINSPTPKTPRYTQRSGGYLLHKPSHSRFSQISLPWQQGLVVVEFDYSILGWTEQHSTDRTNVCWVENMLEAMCLS